MLSIRSFKRGGELFIDALSTFTANELIEYNDFVTLCVIVNTLCLKRVDLKKKVCPVSRACTALTLRRSSRHRK